MKIQIALGGAYLLYVLFGFFIALIIMKNVLQGNVAETLSRSAQELANRVKEYLATTHGIESIRIFLSGQTAIDNSSKNGIVQSNLTDRRVSVPVPKLLSRRSD
jgi:hypothetical protein